MLALRLLMLASALCTAAALRPVPLRSQRAALACRRLVASAPAAADAPALLEQFCLLSGPVSSGYGRGSKKIGVPTANLPTSGLADGAVEFVDGGEGGGAKVGALDALPRGVYVAWAGLRGAVHPAVVNVGLSPTFEDAQNPEPIAEAHLLTPIEDDFYGERLTLLLLGFVRPERKFPSFDELIAAIRSDIATAARALELPAYSACAALPSFVERLSAPAAAAAATEEEQEEEGFSFMAPPPGFECESDEECELPDFDEDDDDE